MRAEGDWPPVPELFAIYFAAGQQSATVVNDSGGEALRERLRSLSIDGAEERVLYLQYSTGFFAYISI